MYSNNKIFVDVLSILIDVKGSTVGAKIFINKNSMGVKEGIFSVNSEVLKKLYNEQNSTVFFTNAILDRNGHVRAKEGNLKKEVIGSKGVEDGKKPVDNLEGKKKENTLNSRDGEGRVYKGLSKKELFKVEFFYHGSPKGIKDDIKPISEDTCDLGKGFYTATDKEYAESNLITGKNGTGYLYTFKVDFRDLKVYVFEDLEFWALYTLWNRGYIEKEKYPLLKRKIKNLNKYDVLYGLIADDRSAHAFTEFANKNTTFTCLEKCINHFDVGYQCVLKTEKACSQIREIDEYFVEGNEYKLIKHTKEKRIGLSAQIYEEYKSKYRTKGKYWDEILEVYK